MLHLIHGLVEEEHIYKSMHLRINLILCICLFLKNTAFTTERSSQNLSELESNHIGEKHCKSKKEVGHNI